MNTNQNSIWTLRDLWDKFLENVWIYVISCTIAVLAVIAYILVTPPKYERTASILIKDDEQGQSIGSQMTEGFADLGLFKTNTNINNEIEVLQTLAFMEEVVGRLELDYIYKQKQKSFRWVDLYKSAPFKVELDNLMANYHFDFNIDFKSADKFSIKDFIIHTDDGDVELSGKIEGTIGKKIKTRYGFITLTATPFFDKGKVVGKKYSFSKVARKNLAKKYCNRLRVALSSKETSIVDLTIVDESHERAENILNTLISVYNENWIKDKNEITFNTSRFIDSRLSVIQQELENVDGSIAEFKSDKLMPDVSAVAGIQLQQTTQNNNEQLVVKNQLSMATYILGYLNSSTGNDQLLPANTGIENNAIESQIEQYNELLLQKNLLMANSSENNPLVADMIKNLQAIKKVISVSVSDLINTLKIQLTNLKTQEWQTKKSLSSTPKQAKELLGVERQQMIKEQLFLYLLQKREENELSQAFSAYNTKVISVADGSKSPKEPKKIMILMLALALGIILPTLYVIIKESFDTLVKSKKDLEGMNIPFLGSVPFVTTPKRQRNKSSINVVVSAGNRNPGNEAFRVLRTNIDFMVDNTRSGAQIVQTISLLSGCGKSFVSINLATSMALTDSKVLVIDCDIRKRTLSKFVTTDKILGLSDYLSGKVNNVEDVLIKGAFDSPLDLLPVGTMPPNPSELLLKPRFQEVILAMKERYDYIFIDCPPVEIVPDAAIIGKFCDASVFVIGAERFDKRLLPEVEAIYESKKYNNMCILLNGVKNRGRGYGYYGRHGYYCYGEKSE